MTDLQQRVYEIIINECMEAKTACQVAGSLNAINQALNIKAVWYPLNTTMCGKPIVLRYGETDEEAGHLASDIRAQLDMMMAHPASGYHIRSFARHLVKQFSQHTLDPDKVFTSVMVLSAKAQETHEDVIEYVIRPLIHRINMRTGRDNDEDFLGYTLKHYIAAGGGAIGY